MFKFFQSKFGSVKVAPSETNREVFDRALGELNGIVALMADKPKITIDPSTGTVSYDLPEQMPDEALALPAPEAEKEEPAAEKEEPAAEVEEKAPDTAEVADEETEKKEEAA